jgi:hypothetical protein
VQIYPEGTGDYTLYEDDGDSLEYLQGAVATTALRCQASASQVDLTIEPRRGSYRHMPAKRAFQVWIHCSQPKAVTVNGIQANWQIDVRLVISGRRGLVEEIPPFLDVPGLQLGLLWPPTAECHVEFRSVKRVVPGVAG